jgi:hypothetical protein
MIAQVAKRVATIRFGGKNGELCGDGNICDSGKTKWRFFQCLIGMGIKIGRNGLKSAQLASRLSAKRKTKSRHVPGTYLMAEATHSLDARNGA